MKFKTLYHVTAGRNIKSIKKNGLQIGHAPVLELVLMGKSGIEKTTKRNVIYFTDREGIDVVTKGWVHCSSNPIALKVKVPVNWLECIEPVSRYYINPMAKEWVSFKSIPVKYIVAAYEVIC